MSKFDTLPASELWNSTRIKLRAQGTLDYIRTAWGQLRLDRQFLITAAIVITAAMTILGAWVSDRIVRGVVQNSAANSALYLVGYVEPLVQELGSSTELSTAAQQRLDSLVKASLLGNRVMAIKVWAPEGRIVYSSDAAMIGKSFPVTEHLKAAWAGSVTPEYNDLSDIENEVERAAGKPMLEIYVPVRDAVSNKVIAVAEIYETAENLARDLNRAYFETSLVVASLSLILLFSLFHIVRRGSLTIEQQQISLSERIDELSRLLTVNQELQSRVANANRRAAQTNEHFLRRIGAELHDGPVQLLGLGLLRLDAIKKRLKPLEDPGKRDDFQITQSALADALKELRGICAGITIPELNNAGLAAALEMAVRNHERRTNTQVDLHLPDNLPDTLSLPINTCLYRFTQEGLNNSFRHAQGKGQKVTARIRGSVIELVVADEGKGTSPEVNPVNDNLASGLGLLGLKNRIEAIGGEFAFESCLKNGTALTCRFNLDQLGLQNE